MRSVRVIGYWRSDFAPRWPDRQWFIDEAQAPELRAQVVAYLREGRIFAVAGAINPCPLCGCNMGHAAQSDGYYYWPGELAHYVEAHAVRLPDEFVQHVKANCPPLPFSLEDSPVDESWWHSQTGWHDGSSIALPATRLSDGSLQLTHITRPLTRAQLAYLRRVLPLHGLSTAALLEKLRSESLPWELGRDFAYYQADSVQAEGAALGISLESQYSE